MPQVFTWIADETQGDIHEGVPLADSEEGVGPVTVIVLHVLDVGSIGNDRVQGTCNS